MPIEPMPRPKKLDDITLQDVLDCMTDRERDELDAVIHTGGINAAAQIATMISRQLAREVSLLQNGGTGR